MHVVDLDAAFTRGTDARVDNHATLKRIVAATGVEVEAGGGVRTLDDCARLFDLGVGYVVLGTAAVKDPAMVEAACARWPQRLVVAVDAREGKVSVEGWTEQTTADATEVGLAVARAGAGAVLYTDIGRDGMRTGPNLEATARLARGARALPGHRLGRRVAARGPRRAGPDRRARRWSSARRSTRASSRSSRRSRACAPGASETR